ncbi:hypothetical protein DFH29DRAFT_1006368 [Suillus ampliporus]|nr:hypothetical protein DFH29DRAFT_1006368 [Suillus ampliporus]
MSPVINSTSQSWAQSSNYIPSIGPAINPTSPPWAWSSTSIPSYGPDCHFYITTLDPVIKFYTTLWALTINPTSPPWARLSTFYTIIWAQPSILHTTLGLVIEFYTTIWARLSLLHHHPGPGCPNLYHHMGPAITSTSPPWSQSLNSIPSHGPDHQFYITTLGPVIKFYTITWARPSVLHHHPGPGH